MRGTAVFLATLAACSSSTSFPTARFANAPIVTAVNDQLDVPKAPKERTFYPALYVFDGAVQAPITRALELRRPRRALGVNALDEVPDSTWFTNRIGVRALTPEEIRTGPLTADPSKHLPWTVTSTKIGGASVGFVMKDSTGVKYVIKFDASAAPPELETGNDAVINRLLWACGYNVAEDQIVYLDPSDLVVDKDAWVKDLNGKKLHRLDAAALERSLKAVHHDSEGKIRMLASRWIDGKTLGGHPGEGVRSDDPNDLIPHELRRDLRGQFSIYAWLDAIDVTEGQYVDSWIADPHDKQRHYMKHYAIDFGMSLSAMAVITFDWWRGYKYRIDIADMLSRIVTVGLAKQPGQDRTAPKLRGVSPMFSANKFDPGDWRSDVQTYTPLINADRFDKFWGAKLISRFTREQIRAAVEAGRFSDPRSIDYVTDTLIARQRVTEAYWFARVNPLDGFKVSSKADGVELCFDDLAVSNGLAVPSTTHYVVGTRDFDAREFGTHSVAPADASGRTCTPPFSLSSSRDGYTIVEIETSRPNFSGRTIVHIAREPTSAALRIIGIWRL